MTAGAVERVEGAGVLGSEARGAGDAKDVRGAADGVDRADGGDAVSCKMRGAADRAASAAGATGVAEAAAAASVDRAADAASADHADAAARAAVADRAANVAGAAVADRAANVAGAAHAAVADRAANVAGAAGAAGAAASTAATGTVSPQVFRDVMACLAMPVAVVSTVDRAGRWHGATLGSVVSLSLEPPLVMFALGRGSSVRGPVCGSARFCVSILAAEQRETAERFAGPAVDRFDGDIVLLDGVPAVGAAAGWLVCTRTELVEAGDHTIVIGRIETALRGPHSSAGPLIYHSRRYHQLGGPAESFGPAPGLYQTSASG